MKNFTPFIAATRLRAIKSNLKKTSDVLSRITVTFFITTLVLFSFMNLSTNAQECSAAHDGLTPWFNPPHAACPDGNIWVEGGHSIWPCYWAIQGVDSNTYLISHDWVFVEDYVYYHFDNIPPGKYRVSFWENLPESPLWDDCYEDFYITVTAIPGNTLLYRDFDGDGWGKSTETAYYYNLCIPNGWVEQGGDCNDGDASIHPNAIEVCNGVDDDCDGLVDTNDPSFDVSSSSLWYPDGDQDGYGINGTPVYACSQPAGYANNVNDCNDFNASINPSAKEVCNGIDDNCNGLIDIYDSTLDFNSLSIYYHDGDQDGYGTNSSILFSCIQPLNYVSNNSDCNDDNSAINPNAVEVCNAIDDNCNGISDEGFDSDNDGYTTCSGDCNDQNASIHPGATEICNNFDEDCDGQIDEGVMITFYQDNDMDGYGNPNSTKQACSQPVGYVSNYTDCNDQNSSIKPSAAEICNNYDDDCDGQIDEGVKITFYKDNDGDNYGNASSGTIQACTTPSGFSTNSTDCNDGNALVHPNATDVPNGIDDNCDGKIDELCYIPTGLTTSDITNNKAIAHWNHAINATQYHIQYAVCFTDNWIDVKFSAQNMTYQISGLSPSTCYKWKIKAICKYEKSIFSEAIKFNTLASKAGDELILPEINTASLNLFPNPTSNYFTIDLKLNATTDEQVSVYVQNALGQMVYSSVENINFGKLNEVITMPSTASSGWYIVRVVMNDQVIEQKLLYQK